METKSTPLPYFYATPKRFMLWDKRLHKFYSGSEGKPYVFDIWSLIEFLKNSQRYPDQLEIVQSTNLFSEDGEEIFEGSIVENESGDIGVIEFENSQWIIDWRNDKFVNYRFDRTDAAYCKCVGHFLSNPELVEGK